MRSNYTTNGMSFILKMKNYILAVAPENHASGQTITNGERLVLIPFAQDLTGNNVFARAVATLVEASSTTRTTRPTRMAGRALMAGRSTLRETTPTRAAMAIRAASPLSSSSSMAL